MSIREELRSRGYHRGGEIRSVTNYECKFDLSSEVPDYVVWIMVVGEEAVFAGQSSKGLRARMNSVASALNGALLGKKINDGFKMFGPGVIKSGGKIEVLARALSPAECQTELDNLKSKYPLPWQGR